MLLSQSNYILLVKVDVLTPIIVFINCLFNLLTLYEEYYMYTLTSLCVHPLSGRHRPCYKQEESGGSGGCTEQCSEDS